MREFLVIVVTTISVIHGSAMMGLAQEHEVVEGGQYLYKKYCTTCHGVGGQGDGPKAPSLKILPANLTLLSKNNGGEFPFWETYRVIDGRDQIFTHGPRDMPVWGVWFQIPDNEGSTETEWADQVRGRLWQLLTYLKTIQE